jgi:hypothetical protein
MLFSVNPGGDGGTPPISAVAVAPAAAADAEAVTCVIRIAVSGSRRKRMVVTP